MMHQGIITKTRANSFFPVWVRRRELSQRLPLGQSDAFYKSLYSSISRCHSWGGGETPRSGHGLFSLEFSPDGTLLVAGSEKNSFRMFDPLTRRLIRTVPNAHAGCVTHVKFLDSRTFATGGVDGCVCLWDTRNLKTRCRTLVGHSRRIGSIEFLRSNDLLITSGLGGIIYIWDLKNCSKRKVFNTLMPHVLLRLRLSPDESKMIISTASGYLLIVHELDLYTIAEDLDEFVVEMIDVAPLLQEYTRSGWNSSLSPAQNRRRNRVEIVADFPNAGGFNVFSALEVHPQGWSVFSRSKNDSSGQEWTCVHDIQEREFFESGAEPRGGSGYERPPFPQQDDAGSSKPHGLQRIHREQKPESGDWGGTGELGRSDIRLRLPCSNDSGPELPDAGFCLERGSPGNSRPGSPTDSARTRNDPTSPSSAPAQPLELADRGSNPTSSQVPDNLLHRFNPSVGQFNRIVHVRCPRLTHFIEEPYFSEWYIESLGVSADGRLVCSPLERGIRLLAFSPECSEQSVSWCGTKPRPLYELSTNTSHSDSVMSTKFSPRHCLLVSGSLDGKLAWYQPVV